VQYVFLELPKYRAGDDPRGTIDRWAYFFREAENLEVVPPALSQAPYREALEVARIAGFSADELDLYDRAKIAEQDARGALSLAKRQSREEGRQEGRADELRASIHTFCQAFGIELGADREAILAGMGTAELKALQVRLFRERRWDP
jgi:hypothetical protein